MENVGLKNVSDVYQVDVTSSRFTSLPTNLQYEVLNAGLTAWWMSLRSCLRLSCMLSKPDLPIA